MKTQAEGPQFVITLGDIPAEGLARIPIAKLGTGYKGKLRFSITKADIAQVVANFRKKENGETVIDYDHSTELVAGGGEPAPASGWLKALDDSADENGVLWGEVDFTEKARKMIAAKEYKYISPVIVWGTRDKKTGDPQGATITSVALTNKPVLEGMPAIALSEGWMEDVQVAQPAAEEKTMIKKLVLADRATCKVLAVLEDGTETAFTVEGLKAEPKVIMLSEVKRTAEGRFDFASLPDGGDVLIAGEVVRAMTVQGELDESVRKGLILPAQRPFYEKLALSDLAGFRGLLATLKPQIEFGERGIGGGEGAGAGDELGKVEAQINGLVQEKLKADKNLQFGQALKLVAGEHPELDKRRTQLTRAKASKEEE